MNANQAKINAQHMKDLADVDRRLRILERSYSKNGNRHFDDIAEERHDSLNRSNAWDRQRNITTEPSFNL